MEPDTLNAICDRRGKFVVRACPGSGKTYSVAMRLKSILDSWDKVNKGVAVLSFTNVAWREIQSKLTLHQGVFTELKYPHFLGTIDSFINNFIFLPFGHLALKCDKRPVMVGEPHNPWRPRRYDMDYDGLFDAVTLDMSGSLTPTLPMQDYRFKWKKENGENAAHVGNLLKMKQKYWLRGYATQQDANYFTVQLLEAYPQLAKEIASRFPVVILDEAQDTSEVQMKILDMLIASGLEEVMLVGDPDQAIFEWNNASPALFETKHTAWQSNSIQVNSNRRSSQVICDATAKLAGYDLPPTAISEDVASFGVLPTIWHYAGRNYQELIDEFLILCKSHQIEISKDNVAVLCRSKSIVNDISCKGEVRNFVDIPPFLYRLLRSCFLYQKGKVQEAIKDFERIFYCLQNDSIIFDKNAFQEFINGLDRFQYRKTLVQMLSMAPSVELTLKDWVIAFNQLLASKTIKSLSSVDFEGLTVSSLFRKDDEQQDYRLDTVHGAKGETFEAVMLILKQKGASGPYYRTMLDQHKKTQDEEELRIVYVGITRPRKLLVLAVPDQQNQVAWEGLLNG